MDVSDSWLHSVVDFSSMFEGRISLSLVKGTSQFLYINLLDTTPPSEIIWMVFDEQLNIVATTNHLFESRTYLTDVINVAAQDTYLSNNGMVFARDYFDLVDRKNIFSISRNRRILNIVSVADTNFVFVNEGGTFGTRLYSLTKKPLVSEDLRGLWMSDKLQNQGLIISHGKREDASEYLFFSFHLYKDGRPFWVAGSSDLDLGRSSITVELSEFSGPSFLDGQRQESLGFSFGEMIIEPIGCNEIQVTIQPESGDAIDLSLNRIVNTGIGNCVQ